jgi:site-specific DNA-adenine methylase
MSLRAPFPWFGGKSRVAPLVWQRFGDVPNYVEPFAGSLAVLLGRPHAPGTETVNDLDTYLSNFWRAVSAEPEAVAAFADWPVNEADLLARHEWLLSNDGFRAAMRTNPDHYDVKVAGWWLWGICSWIGSGWCRVRSQQLPHLGNAGRGIHDYMVSLSERTRRVRVACGEWHRVLGESVTVKHGVTGVFLDPPYDEGGHSVEYSAHEAGVAQSVREWAVANGGNPDLRIALCGYDGEHEMPDGWTVEAWKARGGYGSQSDGRGRSNAGRERIWFSPHCIGASQHVLDLGAA